MRGPKDLRHRHAQRGGGSRSPRPAQPKKKRRTSQGRENRERKKVRGGKKGETEEWSAGRNLKTPAGRIPGRSSRVRGGKLKCAERKRVEQENGKGVDLKFTRPLHTRERQRRKHPSVTPTDRNGHVKRGDAWGACYKSEAISGRAQGAAPGRTLMKELMGRTEVLRQQNPRLITRETVGSKANEKVNQLSSGGSEGKQVFSRGGKVRNFTGGNHNTAQENSDLGSGLSKQGRFQLKRSARRAEQPGKADRHTKSRNTRCRKTELARGGLGSRTV